MRPPGLVASTGPLVNTVFHVGGGAVFHLELGFQNVEWLLVCHTLYFILLQDYFDFRCMGRKIAASGTRCIDGSSSEYCVSRRWGCSFPPWARISKCWMTVGLSYFVLYAPAGLFWFPLQRDKSCGLRDSLHRRVL